MHLKGLTRDKSKPFPSQPNPGTQQEELGQLPEWTPKMSTVWAWLASARIPGLAEVQEQDGSQN